MGLVALRTQGHAESSGLTVKKQLGGLSGRPLRYPYAVVVKTTGVPVADGFKQLHQAVLAMTNIAPLADWTLSESQFIARYGDPETLLALRTRVREAADRARR